jgi:DNA/RNA-binding domain of Phe-tRNA-synthetase-like protein
VIGNVGAIPQEWEANVMTAKKVELHVSKSVFEKGIEVAMAVFSGCNIVNKNSSLERLKKEKVEKIASYDVAASQILREYMRLQREAGIADPMSPAQYLIQIIQTKGRLPNINTVVDCYNLVSAETYLSIGAHDLDWIAGNIRFVTTRGGERYTPLGSAVLESVSPGEYACMDDEKILCRLDLKQCHETKITKTTKQFMVYVQGNHYAPLPMLQAALQSVCNNITEFCGGTFEIVEQKIIPE